MGGTLHQNFSLFKIFFHAWGQFQIGWRDFSIQLSVEKNLAVLEQPRQNLKSFLVDRSTRFER